MTASRGGVSLDVVADEGERKPDLRTVLGTPPPRSRTSGVMPARPARVVTPAPHTIAATVPPVPTPVGSLETAADDSGNRDAADPTTFAPGTRIGQYELIRELGRGGMGIVYAARDTKLGRRVAIKFLRSTSREVTDRFLIEARATARCNHDNIVIVYQVDEVAGLPYLVLEFLEGQELRDVMGAFNDGDKLPPARVVELALPIARALERAHALGIVHRDLKPENVIVTTAGGVKVLDFGISKALGTEERKRASYQDLSSAAASALMLTREGALVGTLPYMAPEQAGSEAVDHRIDLWALGIIMFEMLTGRHPVDPPRNDLLIQNLVLPVAMRSVRDLAPETPDVLVDLVDRCLAKPRDKRIASATEMIAILEELVPGRGGRALRDDESPYPGLSAFQEGDANRFFGRSRDVTRMVAKIREHPLTGVIGPSGTGKSSFVRAGVGPALKAAGERWDVITLRPGRYPMSALAAVVQRLGMKSSDGTRIETDHAAVVRRLEDEPGYLGVLLRERARSVSGHLLLFVDQFEELYTLVPEATTRRAFTAALTGVADDPAAPLRVVISMRSDFLDRVTEDARFTEELTRGLVFLAQPDREGLREALVQPVEMVGYRFETSAVVGEMIDALAGMPGALPLLQFAAAKLWEARDRKQRMLTTSSYHAIGGISGALATHADEVIASMNAASQRIAQRVFRQLVTPERTRAIVELTDLQALGGDRDEITRVIDQLVAARLLVVQTRGDAGGSVELVHESLIDRWPMLQRWLDEDQEDAAYLAQLGAGAKQWDSKGRPVGLLWRGEAMEEARRWHALRPRSLAARDQAFLDAVFALDRRKRRLRTMSLVSAFTILAIIATGASIGFVRVRAAEQSASDNERVAREQAKAAREALANKELEEARRTAAELRAEGALADSERARAELVLTEEQRRLAELERQRADAERARAEADALAGRTKVKLTAEELAAVNADLQVKIGEAKAARDKAERATQAATQAASEAKRLYAELQRVHGELQRSLTFERARVKQLEEEKRKLTTTLK